MRKILFLLVASLLLTSEAFAQAVTAKNLMGLGMPAELAAYVASASVSGTTILNNTYLKAQNAAGNANIDMLKVDAGDETILNSDAGDSVHIQIASDAQRLYNFTAASDIALNLTWGDGGTTAVQVMSVTAGNSDADDDSSLALAGGGGGLTTDGSRGGIIILRGNEVASSGGSISLLAGNASTANINLNIEDSSSQVNIKDITTGTLWSFTNSGALVADSTNAGSIVMAKAATGLVAGEATRAAAVTTATTLAVPLYLSAAASGTHLAAFVGSGASASGPEASYFKTRATSGAATTIVQSGDVLGKLNFYGANGTTYDPAAQIIVTSGGTPGASTDMPGKIDFLTSPDGSVTPASALSLSAAKLATFGGGITLSTASDINFNVGLGTIGFQEAVAGTSCSGTATCNGATDVTTATTCATTGSRIFLQRSSADTDGVGQMYVKSISNGTNFVVNCVTASDTSTFNWVIFHEAP